MAKQDKPKPGQFCIKCGAWLGCLGNEPSIGLYIGHLVSIFAEVKRVLRDDGTCFVNISDSWNGSGGAGGDYGKGGLREGQPKYPGRNLPNLKPKDMCLVPQRLVIALQDDGWWVRSVLNWVKGNVMPSSATDRPTTDFEYVFMLAKSKRYWYDQDAVRQPLAADSVARSMRGVGNHKNVNGAPGQTPHSMNKPRERGEGYSLNPKGRNLRATLFVNTTNYKGAHFATFPKALVRTMLLAGSSDKACPDCGAAWVRVKIKTGEFQRRWGKGNAEGSPYNKQDSMQNTYQELGRKPNCDCYDELYRAFPKAKSPRKREQRDSSGNWWRRVKRSPGLDSWETTPSIVADIFAGSGTVAEVSIEEGRDYLMVEPNPEYVKLIEKRVAEAIAAKKLKDSQPKLFDL